MTTRAVIKFWFICSLDLHTCSKLVTLWVNCINYTQAYPKQKGPSTIQAITGVIGYGPYWQPWQLLIQRTIIKHTRKLLKQGSCYHFWSFSSTCFWGTFFHWIISRWPCGYTWRTSLCSIFRAFSLILTFALTTICTKWFYWLTQQSNVRQKFYSVNSLTLI